MIYSFTHLSSVTGCDELIAQAQRQSTIFNSKREFLESAENSNQVRLATAQADLNTVNQQIAVLQPQVAAIPVGTPERFRAEKQLHDLLSSQANLSYQLTEVPLDRQYYIGQYDVRISEIAVYIAALEARKVELQAA